MTGTMGDTNSSKSRGAALFVTDPDGFIHFGQKDFSVADLAASGGLDDALHRWIDQAVREHHFDLDLGNEVEAVLAPAVTLRVSLLAAVATHLRDRHAFHSDLIKTVSDRFKPVHLHDRLQLHHCVP